jgi:lysophospholipid acyltransferase (LPLAT)-like uncharacterized protein
MNRKAVLRFLGDKLLIPLVNVLCKSLKIIEINKPKINGLSEKKNSVFAFWHGTMLIPWYVIREYSPFTIISQSKDGDLLTKVLNRWKYSVKRGSSSRDGKIVLEELVKVGKMRGTIAITPDGPRGPANKMKAGTVVIAKKAQIPIILIGVGYKKKIKLKSWDQFEIPMFFSRVNLIYSDPIYIDNNLTYEETDKIIKKLGIELNNFQKEAEKLC